jgi:hypothetical protein
MRIFIKFNESFIIWAKTLYSDIQTCVMYNGWVSENFKNSRGKRQGYLLSLPLRHLLYYCKIVLYHRLVVKF